jgi:Cytochrome P450
MPHKAEEGQSGGAPEDSFKSVGEMSRPEIQARAHAELDSVVGRDGWPGAEDEQSLPCIRAIIKEVR